MLSQGGSCIKIVNKYQGETMSGKTNIMVNQEVRERIRQQGDSGRDSDLV